MRLPLSSVRSDCTFVKALSMISDCVSTQFYYNRYVALIAWGRKIELAENALEADGTSRLIRLFKLPSLTGCDYGSTIVGTGACICSSFVPIGSLLSKIA